jgi:hypothetical protein
MPYKFEPFGDMEASQATVKSPTSLRGIFLGVLAGVNPGKPDFYG